MLKIIAGIEKAEIEEILSGLIDEYIERHKETLELLSNPEWVDLIQKGKKEVRSGDSVPPQSENLIAPTFIV